MKPASRLFVSLMGAYVGLMGIEHGLGEILQGAVPPAGLVFSSWLNSEFFRILSGEPAFSIIPNLRLTGILASAFSIAYILTAVFHVDKKFSVTVMLTLSVLMFLTGAGIFPPLFAVFMSLSAGRLNRPVAEWRKLPQVLQNFTPRIWPWSLWLCLVFWLAMVPGVPAMDYFLGYSNNFLIFAFFLGMVIFLVLSNISSRAFDLRSNDLKT